MYEENGFTPFFLFIYVKLNIIYVYLNILNNIEYI